MYVVVPSITFGRLLLYRDLLDNRRKVAEDRRLPRSNFEGFDAFVDVFLCQLLRVRLPQGPCLNPILRMIPDHPTIQGR